MKILLINPPHLQKKGAFPRIVFEPIGLSYIAAILLENNYKVEILDTIGLGFNKKTELDEKRELIGLNYLEIENVIREKNPDIVGIAVPFTMRAESAFKIASIVKLINSKTITILGGIHISSYSEESIKNPNVDYVVTGEGEIATLKLVKAIKKNDIESMKFIDGIGYKLNEQYILNPQISKIDNLDEIPFPARQLLPMSEYVKASKLLLTGRTGNRFNSVVTSRGCPFKCTFCVSYKLMGRQWRFRSPENVVNEIEHLVKTYKTDFIHFEDDNLTYKKERIMKICDLIIERKLKIKWDTPNGVRADTLDEEVVRKMKESGCSKIYVAPESGNQYVVDNIIKKKMNLQKVEEVVKLCKKHGIKVEAFYVIGNMGETKEQIQDTINYAKKLRKYGVSKSHFHIATPFEGTELYIKAKNEGCLVDAYENGVKAEAQRIQTKEFTVKDIDDFLMKGSKTNPKIPLDKIHLSILLFIRNPLRLFKAVVSYIFKGNSGLNSFL
ncbi:MAG: hypothetical protein A2231_02395 [Candidatus Firestonebacteria bacterium RIFOXYA2_FULL_40_8]|nr:MAG: hypothetical protein A2231_02395 [Candidatus Firestonebacteria bacterium RIFOXYA2_FULL_40_8]